MLFVSELLRMEVGFYICTPPSHAKTAKTRLTTYSLNGFFCPSSRIQLKNILRVSKRKENGPTRACDQQKYTVTSLKDKCSSCLSINNRSSRKIIQKWSCFPGSKIATKQQSYELLLPG